MQSNIINPNAVMPNWLIKLCSSKISIKAKPPLQITSEKEGIFAKGTRNTNLASLAGNMRRNGANEETIYKALTALNDLDPDPLPDSEVRSIAGSIGRYPVSPDGFTNDSFANLLEKEIEGQVLYCAGMGFYYFNGKVWSQDKENLYILNKARELSDKIHSNVIAIRENCTSDEYNKLVAAVKRTKSSSFLRQSIELLKSDPRVHVVIDDFDKNKNLINLQNGTYNLQTGEFYAHRYEDKLSHILDYEYDKDAKASNFEKLLRDILGPEVREFVLRLFGYGLLGQGKEQKFFIFYGRGKNGKSTLIQAIESVLSQLVITIQADSLNGKMDGQIRNDLARLPNKRILFTNETRAGSILDAPLMKQITGQDKMAARFLHKEYFEFIPVCVPILVSNHKPIIDGSDFAIERRICLLIFDQVVQNVDPTLGEKLSAEKAGIFNMILGGLTDYRENGLNIPQLVAEQTKNFIERSNLMKGFFSDTLTLDASSKVAAYNLYVAYMCWCDGNGYKPLSINLFKEAFERETGIEQQRDGQSRYWPGIKINLH